ncbi:DUF4276 family protein [Bacteroides heparinolyticus]|uniref:DUF4276 family protein n=1 Tax=Prevotella heparinolytica TaxID=28113 RepID=UPI0028EEBAFC|nr:DUF4276 family protein [Bacteroides heparinolyticus]
MIAKIIHVLCEGQTEQGFVEEVLKPYLKEHGVTGVKSILITTNKKKNARGGMLTYVHALTDINLLMQTKQDGEYERHIFTTMFDLYALPEDFPGFAVSKTISDPYARTSALEADFADAIKDERFIPYIQIYEFEALLFCGIEYITTLYPGCENSCKQLTSALRKVGNPELINNSPETAPSKRIIKAIEGNKKKHYNYNKPATGKYVTKNIGIDRLRIECRHFNEWIEKLINC